jgi:isopentenyl-diphosphate delta-isomerase
MTRTVTRTDETGTDLGQVDLLEAHTGSGTLHKAFSVFVFSPDKTLLLLQQRSMKKMLFAGIWANTCCSHPLQDETPTQAGERRMQEELGVSCPLQIGASFVYRAEDPNGKGVEHEFDTILLGTLPTDTVLSPDPNEVMATQWVEVEELKKALVKESDKYAPWLHKGLPLALGK